MIGDTVVGDTAPRSTPDRAWQMRDALGRGDFHLVYQPEFDLRTSTVVGLEALLRWNHPTLGALEPSSFIPLAEQNEVIGELGSWVIDAATAEYARWSHRAPLGDLVLRINVSATQLSGPELLATFRGALDRTGLEGRRLCAEITESTQVEDTAAVRAAVRELQQLGIAVAMDDLGTGFSSLGALRLLPFDVLKVDRSLVAGIDTDERAVAIVSSVLELARRLGAEVVAEGVGNDREVATLLGLGCHRAQGHHLGRPIPGAEVLGLLARTNGVTPARPRPRPYPAAGTV